MRSLLLLLLLAIALPATAKDVAITVPSDDDVPKGGDAPSPQQNIALPDQAMPGNFGMTPPSVAVAPEAPDNADMAASPATPPPSGPSDAPLPPMNPDEPHQIAAVVNDNIITRLELEERMRLAIATTGLSDNADVRRQLLTRILQTLIDESLQMQDAKKNSITVEPAEVDHAISTLEQERGRPPGSLVAFLEARGVPEQTMRKQIETQLAWNKLIGKTIRKTVRVSNSEVNAEIERRTSPAAKKEEALIASLVLPVESPEAEAATKELGNKLISEIHNGVSFDALASQLGTTQAAEIGATWVDIGQLEAQIAVEVDQAKAPAIIGPVRTPSGYQILDIKEKRETSLEMADAELAFKRIQLSLGADAQNKEVDILMKIARDVAKAPGQCSEKTVAGIQSLEGLNIEVDMQRTHLADLSGALRPLVEGLSVGQVSEPFATPKGIELLMLCEKTDLPLPAPDRDKVREQIYHRKLELEVQKYLRNLRRNAYIDVRVHPSRAKPAAAPAG